MGRVVKFTNIAFLYRFLCLLQQINTDEFLKTTGARCSSVVSAFAHGAMGRRIERLMVVSLSYFSFQPVSHDWCYPVCGMMHIKEPLLLIGKSSQVAAVGFLSRYLIGPLPYVCRHITVNKMC